MLKFSSWCLRFLSNMHLPWCFCKLLLPCWEIAYSGSAWPWPDTAFWASLKAGEAACSWTGKRCSQIRNQDTYTGVLTGRAFSPAFSKTPTINTSNLKPPTPTAATDSQLNLQTTSISNHERRQVLHGLGKGDPGQCPAEGLERCWSGIRYRDRKRE